MKKLLIIFILISKIGFGQDTKYLSENYEFKNGEVAYMFGNDVKLRDQPTAESNVLTLLKIGEQIEIIEKSNSTMQFDGIESPWYKVKTKDKVGFVLGSLISLDKATNGNLTYLVGGILTGISGEYSTYALGRNFSMALWVVTLVSLIYKSFFENRRFKKWSRK